MNIQPPRLPSGEVDFKTLFIVAEQIGAMLKAEFGSAYELTRAMILLEAEAPRTAPSPSRGRQKAPRLKLVSGGKA